MALHDSDQGFGLWFYCPGCKCSHRVPVNKDGTRVPNKRWNWNQDLVKPTLDPSINHPGICHYFIRDGNIEFCADSKHELAGKTVALSPCTQYGDPFP